MRHHLPQLARSVLCSAAGRRCSMQYASGSVNHATCTRPSMPLACKKRRVRLRAATAADREARARACDGTRSASDARSGGLGLLRVQPACCLLHVVRCVLHAMCCTLRLLLADIAASCIASPAVLCVVAPRGLAMAYVSCMADDCMPRAVWCSCRSRRCGSTSCCRTSASLSGR